MVYAGYLLPLLALSLQALASYDGNLNYRSPSLRHGGLGVDVELVKTRSLTKRDESPAYRPSDLNFTHGVASGDPYPNSVILWTRVAPSLESDDSNVTVSGNVPLYNHDRETYIQQSPHPICVDYHVFSDKDAKQVVDQGKAYTTSDIDYTIKACTMNLINTRVFPDKFKQVEAKELEPFTTYYYQFTICNSDVSSRLGRTKTTPAPDSHTEELRLAVYSCSNYSMITRPVVIDQTNPCSRRLLQRLWERCQEGQC